MNKPYRPESSWFAVVHTYQLCTRQYERMLDVFDLTIPQFDVMSVIDQLHHRAMPKEIAEHLVVTRGNITGLLKRLEARGLVESRVHESDGRARICSLTSEGQKLLGRARTAARRFIHTQLEPFTDADLERSHKLMNRMARQLESMDPVALAKSA